MKRVVKLVFDFGQQLNIRSKHKYLWILTRYVRIHTLSSQGIEKLFLHFKNTYLFQKYLLLQILFKNHSVI